MTSNKAIPKQAQTNVHKFKYSYLYDLVCWYKLNLHHPNIQWSDPKHKWRLHVHHFSETRQAQLTKTSVPVATRSWIFLLLKQRRGVEAAGMHLHGFSRCLIIIPASSYPGSSSIIIHPPTSTYCNHPSLPSIIVHYCPSPMIHHYNYSHYPSWITIHHHASSSSSIIHDKSIAITIVINDHQSSSIVHYLSFIVYHHDHNDDDHHHHYYHHPF